MFWSRMERKSFPSFSLREFRDSRSPLFALALRVRYRDERMINYDQGVEVAQKKMGSILTVHVAAEENSGEYKCSPQDATSAKVSVHVLNEDYSNSAAAAVHTDEEEASVDLKTSSSRSDDEAKMASSHACSIRRHLAVLQPLLFVIRLADV